MSKSNPMHHEENPLSRKINTEFVYPPIPYRGSDWMATYDDYDGAPDISCPMGKGATEQEAIDDLLSQEDA